MPRGKFLNHKGRNRQFTPIEELQREQELDANLNASEDEERTNALQPEKDHNGKVNNIFNKKLGGPVNSLIVISNPNRPLIKQTKKPHKTGSSDSLLLAEQQLASNKRLINLNKKTPSETKADLARLALVRKKREAAAKERLAAKRDNNPVPIIVASKSRKSIKSSKSSKSSTSTSPSASTSSKVDVSLKKNKNQKAKAGCGLNQFLKTDDDNSNDNMRKIMKVRNGNKRNVNLHI